MADRRANAALGLGPKAEVTLTAEQFKQLRELIYRDLGLYFEDAKVYFLSKRVERRMRSLGMDQVSDYLFHLRFTEGPREMQELANLITTNETYMFREYEQLATFSDFCLPLLLEQKLKSGNRRLRIWSAGCASGDEPYTLAIILREVIDDFSRWKIQLTATDISQNALKTARRGLYSERSIKDVPTIYLNKYFKLKDNLYQLLPPIIDYVDFQHANLLDRKVASELDGLDFVFCRNVLIYFDDISARKVVDSFYDALRPGGFILLGHSESVGRITSAFKLERMGDMLVYMK